MRIVAISDIHARRNGLDDDLVCAIRSKVEEYSPDVFIVAGDVSENAEILRRTLRLLAVPDAANLYVAGNHDIWFEERSGLGSFEKYSSVIGDICRDAGFVHIPDEPYIQGSVAFVGSMGWYDYSFRRVDLDISEKHYLQKQWRGYVWRDYYAIDWPYTDQEFTTLLNGKLNYDLETLPEHIEQVVYVSHHLPFRDLTFYKDSLPWDFFSAFMGSVKTGEILKQDGRVLLSISGHSHIRRRVEVDGLTAITVPLGYGRPPDNVYESLVQDAIAILKLGDTGLFIEHFVEGDICEGLPYIF